MIDTFQNLERGPCKWYRAQCDDCGCVSHWQTSRERARDWMARSAWQTEGIEHFCPLCKRADNAVPADAAERSAP